VQNERASQIFSCNIPDILAITTRRRAVTGPDLKLIQAALRGTRRAPRSNKYRPRQRYCQKRGEPDCSI